MLYPSYNYSIHGVNPSAVLRLPDHGARSDVIRYALIYHHGSAGLYGV